MRTYSNYAPIYRSIKLASESERRLKGVGSVDHRILGLKTCVVKKSHGMSTKLARYLLNIMLFGMWRLWRATVEGSVYKLTKHRGLCMDKCITINSGIPIMMYNLNSPYKQEYSGKIVLWDV